MRHGLFTWAVVLWCCLPSLLLAQGIEVNGVLLDANTHAKLQNVNLVLKDSNIGAVSDPGGRFQIIVPDTAGRSIVFRHIAYEPLELPVHEVLQMKTIKLRPRVIPLEEVTIEGEGLQEIAKDLPQTVSTINARDFEVRGYVDAGDLLKTDVSIQIDEELTGKKTVAIRGGSADEVVVMYDGIKMNMAYDNVFDLSLIDLEDVERVELIKGSNTALYGPEAFSGVINIVPKTTRDYAVRFQQRIGSYNSGNWGLHINPLHLAAVRGLSTQYSLRCGGSERNIIGFENLRGLANSTTHHTGYISYDLQEAFDLQTRQSISATLVSTSFDHENDIDLSGVENTHRMLSLKYQGVLPLLGEMKVAAATRRFEDKRSFGGLVTNDLEEKSLQLNVEKAFHGEKSEFMLSYQLQSSDLAPFGYERKHHGFVGIAKYHGETGSDFFDDMELNASLRHDMVADRQNGIAVLSLNNDWQETDLKLGMSLQGHRQDLLVDAYLNYGGNVKFPSLFQQALVASSLKPEENNSFELGLSVTRDLQSTQNIAGWRITTSFFRSLFTNKIRVFKSPVDEIALFDNVDSAQISGFEGKATGFLFQKKITVEASFARYFIPDLTAFPYKSDSKVTLNLFVDHAGFSFQIHLFDESGQVGWSRTSTSFQLIDLPEQTNLDLHLSKSFSIGPMTLFANASGRNLLNGDLTLQGLAIRDRRYYITVGAQY